MIISFTTKRIPCIVALTLAVGLASAVEAAAQDAALVKSGEQVYAAQKCQTCHSIAGKGAKTNPLDGVGTKLTAASIKEWITHPTEAAKKANSSKKPPMPAKWSGLPAADVDALVAYMQSLK